MPLTFNVPMGSMDQHAVVCAKRRGVWFLDGLGRRGVRWQGSERGKQGRGEALGVI